MIKSSSVWLLWVALILSVYKLFSSCFILLSLTLIAASSSTIFIWNYSYDLLLLFGPFSNVYICFFCSSLDDSSYLIFIFNVSIKVSYYWTFESWFLSLFFNILLSPSSLRMDSSLSFTKLSIFPNYASKLDLAFLWDYSRSLYLSSIYFILFSYYLALLLESSFSCARFFSNITNFPFVLSSSYSISWTFVSRSWFDCFSFII